ncbi:hypothetical protein, conserved [Leishmania tarentolae]|uniref:Uncharacterized protein n=1 Tax=Leishmania tarentolae TaxID=5689 RepID=A0A640KF75_LEITA|nr:hypothetical protein, conserved [Leishmania tarentolae]
MPTSTSVSVRPTIANGVLCNSFPMAAATSVGNTAEHAHTLPVASHDKQFTGNFSGISELYGQEGLLPTASATTTADRLRKSIVEAPPLAATANRSPLPSSERPVQQPYLAAEHHESQRVQHMLSLTSAELSAVVGGGASCSAPVLSDVSASSFSVPLAVATTRMMSSYRPRKKISWQCTLCGYHVLAMDQDGAPLPFTTSAFGNVLPMTCPRCKMHHTSWQPSTPFSEDGNHMNMPTTLSNRYLTPLPGQQPLRLRDMEATGSVGQSDAGVGTTSSMVSGSYVPQRAAFVSALATQQRNAAAISAMSSAQRRAHYCGRCGRRLLRVDANGELVDMDRDKDGHVLPITCPGCKESHSDWVLKPYAVNR